MAPIGAARAARVTVLDAIPDSGISRYPFEQSVKDVWDDNDGTDNTSAGYTTDSYQGDYAKSFDGVDDEIPLGVNGMPTGDSEISILLWVKTTDSDGIIWGYGNDSADQGIGITCDSGVFIWGQTATGPAVNDGTWTQVGLRYQPGDMDMIVDGSTINAYSRNINLVNTYHLFGNNLGSATNYLSGDIDDPRIYDKRITDSEVTNHFNTGRIRG